MSEWFGYDRRERRATLIILILIVITGLSRFTVRERHEVPSISVLTVSGEAHAAGERTTAYAASGEAVLTRRPPPHQLINLNLCDSADLEKLPGIGPILSARIVKYRNLLGGYADVRQLLEVYGLREEVFEIIKERVSADTTLLKKISVNSDSYSVLLRHPYLDPEHVTAIVRYRERIGPITEWKTLLANNMIPPEKEEFLRYYIIYR